MLQALTRSLARCPITFCADLVGIAALGLGMLVLLHVAVPV